MNPDLQKQVDELTKAFNSLKDEFYRGNFASSQDVQKYLRVNSRLKLPTVDALSTVCNQGEACVLSTNGKLYICSASNTWTAQT